MSYLEHIKHGFQNQTKRQKIVLIAGFGLILSVTAALLIWVMSPHYGVLFNHLDSQDASQILSQLDAANIPYKVRSHGSEILIHRAMIDKTRIRLMGADLNLQSVGFELFDKTDFGMSEFSQKINYQRALQGELERTIGSLDEVKKARVQLVIPESHLFQEDNNVPRAAVTLKLSHPLTLPQIRSIQQLITASVAHLSLSNVVILDQHGNGLTTHEDDAEFDRFTAKKSVERYLSEKVMHMLTKIFTHDNVMVKIDTRLNYDELQRELIQPKQSGLVTHEKETRHTSTPNKTEKQPSNQDISLEKSYELGREKERFIRANGTIERLTISVVLPKNTDAKKIAQVEQLVKAVVGFDVHRGDAISVEALIMEHKPQSVKRTQAINSIWPTSIVYVLAAIITVPLLIGFVLHRQKRLERRQVLLNELRQWLLEHD